MTLRSRYFGGVEAGGGRSVQDLLDHLGRPFQRQHVARASEASESGTGDGPLDSPGVAGRSDKVCGADNDGGLGGNSSQAVPQVNADDGHQVIGHHIWWCRQVRLQRLLHGGAGDTKTECRANRGASQPAGRAPPECPVAEQRRQPPRHSGQRSRNEHCAAGHDDQACHSAVLGHGSSERNRSAETVSHDDGSADVLIVEDQLQVGIEAIEAYRFLARRRRPVAPMVVGDHPEAGLDKSV